ncbi:hypothetical protein [Ensifer adhaerens]|uniref:hypothetical protein n=1 Tax=Ensifer adhaerens TaxID=106592 RepID=UPI000DC2939F|nr:hypothetical protein [Ensifer adhaerens]RAS13505.1 hypothetical protein DEU52_106103 [Ensifer adhaerens]
MITDEMKVAAVKAYTEVDGKCRPAAMQKALEAALSTLPIAVEGKAGLVPAKAASIKEASFESPIGHNSRQRSHGTLNARQQFGGNLHG